MQAEDLAAILEIPLASSRRFLREAQHLVQRVGAAPEDGVAPAAQAPAAGESAIQRVLGAWRAMDAEAAAAGDSVVEAPEREREPGTPLRPQMLDGLDHEWCVRLHTCGVDSLQELAVAESMELARAMDVGLTRLMRLQFLARRELESSRPSGASADLLWPVPAPRVAPRVADAGELREALRFSPADTPRAPGVPLAPELSAPPRPAPREAPAGGPFA
jgi:hypothetical protein